ncbi:TadE family protein [Methyloparacoccus murrellii]
MSKRIKPCRGRAELAYGQRQAGLTVVETALVLPLAFMLIFSVLEYGRLFWLYESVNYAANRAARVAARKGNGGEVDEAAITGIVRAFPGLESAIVNQVWEEENPNERGGTMFAVTVSVPYTAIVPHPFVPGNISRTLTSTSETVIFGKPP